MRYDAVCPQTTCSAWSCSPNLKTEFDRNDRNALSTLENYGGYNNRFFLAVIFF